MANVFDTPLCNTQCLMHQDERMQYLVSPINGSLRAVLNKQYDCHDEQRSAPKVGPPRLVPAMIKLAYTNERRSKENERVCGVQ